MLLLGGMIEHYTKSVVLSREPKREFDEVFTLYTKDLGKVFALAKSIRRITSKLSGHLIPGSLNKIRLIEKNGSGFQIIDALSEKLSSNEELPKFLNFLDKMTAEGEADFPLWTEVELIINSGHIGAEAYWRLLEILGSGPEFAKCENCGSPEIAYFMPADVVFLCGKSLETIKINENEIVKIK